MVAIYDELIHELKKKLYVFRYIFFCATCYDGNQHSFMTELQLLIIKNKTRFPINMNHHLYLKS